MLFGEVLFRNNHQRERERERDGIFPTLQGGLETQLCGSFWHAAVYFPICDADPQLGDTQFINRRLLDCGWDSMGPKMIGHTIKPEIIEGCVCVCERERE